MLRYIVHLLKEMDTLTITGLDSIVKYSLLSSVNSDLQKQQPMLLPQVYKNYCTSFHDAASSRTMSQSFVVAPAVVNTRYLLSYLVTRVGKHLQYTVKQRSAGTLLYRRGSDPLLILTKVLHRVHSGFYRQHHQAPKDETEMNQATTTCTSATDKNSKIWEEMNTKILFMIR